jgi:hypothetical protein
MIINKRTQHPVGQGFFHSGEIRVQEAVIRYVYDCGSENDDSLNSAVSDYASQEDGSFKLDILFLSHLDSDHVSGLDRLLIKVPTATVVLPYLSNIDRLIIIAKAIEDDKLTGTLFSFASDPDGWFVERGVEHIIYVEGSNDGNDEPPQLPPEPVLPFDDPDDFSLKRVSMPQGLQVDLNHLRNAATQPVRHRATSIKQSAEVFHISHRTPVQLLWGESTLDWVFIMFTHPEFEREDRFRKLVRSEFGNVLGEGIAPETMGHVKLIEVLQNKEMRDRLADCYGVIRRDRNLTSMSLYSGPTKRHKHVAVRTRHGGCGNASQPIAWLATGDANLKTKSRRFAFVQHYSNVRSIVHTLCLPHHGSKYNFHSELIDKEWRYVASAGKNNSYGHPHEEVITLLRSELHTVTEKHDSILQEVVYISQQPIDW